MSDLDFDETDVFGEEESPAPRDDLSESESEEDAAGAGGEGGGEGMRGAGERDTEPFVKFSDQTGTDFTMLATTAPSKGPMHITSAMRKGSNPYDYMSQSLTAQLGTSAPIAIPRYGSVMNPGMMAAKPMPGAAGAAEEGDTMQFVPPHMMTPQAESHMDEFGDLGQNFSVESHLRRDRLRMRTAVLRSTGFIEPSKAEPVPGGGGGVVERPPRHSQLVAEQGALSAAFSPTQTVSLAAT